MQVAIVVNPAAGRGQAVRVADAMLAQLAARGIRARQIQAAPGHVPGLIAEIAASRPSAVIACGGDGTVHECMQALVGTDIAFAILPSGTGNDIGGALGFPKPDAVVLARAIDEQRSRAIDVGTCTTQDGRQASFLGVLSTGFDSTVNERANRMTWPGGRARYLAGVALELGRFTPRKYEVEVDGVTHRGSGMLVCIANAGTYGGGMKVCPEARVDDGLLDVTWVEAISTPQFLRLLPTVFSGTHVRHEAVRTMRGASIRVACDGQLAYADGERIGPLPVNTQVRPGALRIVAP